MERNMNRFAFSIMVFLTGCAAEPQSGAGPVSSDLEGATATEIDDSRVAEPELAATRGSGSGSRPQPSEPLSVDLSEATPVEVWATHYYAIEVDSVHGGTGVPLRDMSDAVIGPSLSALDWCRAAIEGSVRVDGKVFNFADTRDPRQASCPAHAPSERVRWQVTLHEFGTGSSNNPLVPYRTIACDLGTVSGSQAWVDGGFPAFGQKLFVPAAQSVRLPNGEMHDGIFTCGDIGGAITGNHIDVFIGGVRGGEAAAREKDPFDFVRSSPDHTTRAFLLP